MKQELGKGHGSNHASNHHKEELRELVRMRKRGMYVYALPNLLTAMNFLLGFLSILASMEGRFDRAVWAILLASVFDMLDGRVARLTNTTSKFGVEFDSLCDLVSFGIAPAILMYFSALKPFGRVGIVVAVIFGLCGALRLARFNVMAEVLPKSYFQGLPIPMASLTVCSAYFFAKDLGLSIDRSYFFLALTAALGLLMVSTFKFPSFKDFHFRRRRQFTPIALSFALLLALISWFEIVAFLLLLGYIFFSLTAEGYRTWKAQWKKKAA
jgi:CDP-diacylglycerol---serine O-phosphatidyltransferase